MVYGIKEVQCRPINTKSLETSYWTRCIKSGPRVKWTDAEMTYCLTNPYGCPPLCPTISSFVQLPVCPTIHLTINLSVVHPNICTSMLQTVRPADHQSVHPSGALTNTAYQVLRYIATLHIKWNNTFCRIALTSPLYINPNQIQLVFSYVQAVAYCIKALGVGNNNC